MDGKKTVANAIFFLFLAFSTGIVFILHAGSDRQTESQIEKLPSVANGQRALGDKNRVVAAEPHPAEVQLAMRSEVLTESTLVGSEAPIVLVTIHDFIDHLDGEKVDIDSVVDFASYSDEAFDYVRSEYLMVDESDRKQLMMKILSNCDHPGRVDLALELVSSTDLNNRKAAYQWLIHSDSAGKENGVRVSRALLHAMEYEQDTQLLADIVGALHLPTLPGNSTGSVLREIASTRLNELTFHENEAVSAQAIVKAVQLNQDKSTLDMLLFHVENSSTQLQLAAIEGLKNLDYPSDNIMYSLDTLTQNPSVEQPVRMAAVELIVAYENYILPPEDMD